MPRDVGTDSATSESGRMDPRVTCEGLIAAVLLGDLIVPRSIGGNTVFLLDRLFDRVRDIGLGVSIHHHRDLLSLLPPPPILCRHDNHRRPDQQTLIPIRIRLAGGSQTEHEDGV